MFDNENFVNNSKYLLVPPRVVIYPPHNNRIPYGLDHTIHQTTDSF